MLEYLARSAYYIACWQGNWDWCFAAYGFMMVHACFERNLSGTILEIRSWRDLLYRHSNIYHEDDRIVICAGLAVNQFHLTNCLTKMLKCHTKPRSIKPIIISSSININISITIAIILDRTWKNQKKTKKRYSQLGASFTEENANY